MNRYVLSEEAELDFYEALSFIEPFSEKASVLLEAAFIEAFVFLGEWPDLGHNLEGLASPNLRSWHVKDYLVIYEPGTKPLLIHAVIHAARDLPTVLQQRIQSQHSHD